MILVILWKEVRKIKIVIKVIRSGVLFGGYWGIEEYEDGVD